MADIKATISQPVTIKATIQGAGPRGATGETGATGNPGQEVLFQVSGGFIQWKYTDDVSWTNLIAVADLKGDQGDQGVQGNAGTNGTNGTNGDDGREVELQKTATHIQWRYVGEVSWTNLVALVDIKGDQGIQGIQGVPGNDGADGIDGDDAYVYIAYASDDTGTDFTLVFDPALNYIAIKHTTTAIPSPIVSDFAGLWKNYKGATGATGAPGAGSGDVMGPAANNDLYIPQWDGANSKTLKNGLGLDTDLASVSASDDTVPSAKATKDYADTKWSDDSTETGTNKTLNSLTNYIDADAIHLKVLLDLGGASSIGMPVFGTTWNAGNSAITVQKAKANAAGTMPCIGLMEQAVADGSVAEVRTKGVLINVNTNAWSEGAVLYVSPTTAGVLTTTPPSGATEFLQRVGTVLKQDATTGVIEVNIGMVQSLAVLRGTNTGDQDLSGLLPKAGGTLTGEVDLGENAGLIADAALSADGKYSGIVRAGTAGATLAFGDLCYLDPTDSRWELADANAAAAADGDSRGILGICVLAAGADGNATKMLLWGFVNAATAFPALTINAPAYVSETAGDIVVTQPTTTDVVIRVVGVAVTGDELFFNPSPDYMTHA